MIQNNLIKTWCKSCQNFIIHKWIDDDNLICNTCYTKYTKYLYSEIPEDKLQEQRERYSKNKMVEFHRMINPLNYLGFNHTSKFAQSNQNIIQDSAGQKQIDKKNNEDRKKLIDNYNQLKDEYRFNYSKLNRNDKCSCGSGIKYKKCHYQYFQKLKII